MPILIRRPFFIVFVFISIIRTVFVTGLIAVTKVDLLGLVELIEIQTAEQVLQVSLALKKLDSWDLLPSAGAS